jgi:hypothetical protein
MAINKWVQDVYHVDWLYNNNRVNKTEAIIWLCVLCIVFACFAPIVFICVVAFIDAVLKKLDKLSFECLGKQLSSNKADLGLLFDKLIVYLGIAKEKCTLDATVFNVNI